MVMKIIIVNLQNCPVKRITLNSRPWPQTYQRLGVWRFFTSTHKPRHTLGKTNDKVDISLSDRGIRYGKVPFNLHSALSTIERD